MKRHWIAAGYVVSLPLATAAALSAVAALEAAARRATGRRGRTAPRPR
ncbi:hypothetical protein SAMN05421748_107339 [Paractinoplanes atraurantiacus]|uniref:Uncharacterized protein n=1 Tax=Paractinoplanes atraurantiacus TaxID=1036182 RepID=A0A285IDB6_9ACTN|nr:hypothetical protein SAMN05421748_107339 [Actinoplanes atraurantiacus]